MLYAYLAVMVRNRLLDAVRYHEASRRDERRPFYVSRHFYPRYTARVAAAAAEWGCEALLFVNFAQMAKPLRAALPDARLAIQMQCQWLAQLDPVHLDGFDFMPYFSGETEEGPRESFFYFSDGGDLMNLRYNR